MMKSCTNLGSRVSFGLGSLGKNLGPIGSILFRLALVAIFFWYLCEFTSALSTAQHPGWVWVLRAASIVLLVVFLTIVVIAAYRFDPTAKPEQASIMSFILLNLVPITVVAIAVRAEHEFSTPLLKFTYGILKRFKDAYLL
jgi:hypothetical protein